MYQLEVSSASSRPTLCCRQSVKLRLIPCKAVFPDPFFGFDFLNAYFNHSQAIHFRVSFEPARAMVSLCTLSNVTFSCMVCLDPGHRIEPCIWQLESVTQNDLHSQQEHQQLL